MNRLKITIAIERLEQNLPIRLHQLKLPEELRQLHKDILRHYLDFGSAPQLKDINYLGDWLTAIHRLAAEQIIVIDEAGAISAAYPFNNEARGFKVISDHSETNAMCAFDALAISSMFDLPTQIESHCRVSGDRIFITQNDKDLTVNKPNTMVFAAIDWNSQDIGQTCSATLCTEMSFIAGNTNAQIWYDVDSENRELFQLDEAHQLITSIFLPLVK